MKTDGHRQFDDPIVDVRGLAKKFTLKQKEPGLRGSIRSLWKTTTVDVSAVSDVSFQLQEGEMLGFIGPNGAGKSTTIKMLTGILYPSAGQASVLGYTPWKDRRKLGYHIGTVFGQKPQLWYHLPPEDTFRLFAHIYELDMDAYQTAARLSGRRLPDRRSIADAGAQAEPGPAHEMRDRGVTPACTQGRLPG